MSVVPNAANIDPLATARAIIADPRQKFTMSTLQIIAVCKALVDTIDNPRPVISPELASAARALIAAEATATLAKGPEGYAPLPYRSGPRAGFPHL